MSGDQGIMDAFREAVGETMREIETEMKTRVRKAGRTRTALPATWSGPEFHPHHVTAGFEGVPDPQLHAHCFVFNATYLWRGNVAGKRAIP